MSPANTGYQPRTAKDALPRPAAGNERKVGQGLLALLGVLVLGVGVPVALVLFVGNPLPTSLPTRDWLTADISATVIIRIIAALVWVVWAHFVVCLLSEWRAIRAGRMPDAVPFGGGSQLVARRLIAGLLLLTGAATLGGQLGSRGDTAAPPQVTTVAAAAQRVGLPTPLLTPEMRADTAVQAASAHGATTATRPEVTKFYEVKPPAGRHHDTLWDIADRTLGEPLRYKEIYALNKDRPQADGRKLVDANLIQPGWQLVMPADATGPGIRTVDAPRVAPTPAGQGSATSARTGVSGGQSADLLHRSDVRTTVTESTPQEQGIDLGRLLLGGGLVLAGLVSAVTARRGPYGEPSEGEGSLRLAANTQRADLLDRALRVLSESRAAQGLPMPDLSVVYLSDEQVVAHVVGDVPAPQHPWRAAEDARSWSLHADDLGDVHSTAAAPYPALVNIAESHGYDVLVDLEYAPGLVALGGDDAVAREVVMSTVVDLATHAWSDTVDITLVGFGDDVSGIAPSRMRQVAGLEEALADLEAKAGSARQLVQRLGVDGVLSGRGLGRHDELTPRVLVLSGAPTAEQAQRITALSSAGRSAFAAVCVGDAPTARWRFVVEASGHIDLGVLGINGVARRYTTDSHQLVASLLRDASAGAAESSRSVAAATPSSLATPVRATPAQRAGAAVRVQLLGEVGVTAPGVPSGPRQDLLTELVVMAALHPGGLHESVLRANLWPRGVEDDVVASTVADAQAWLGVDAAGRHRLDLGADGLWHLTDDVHVDWDELQARAGASGPGEGAALADALTLVRGPAFSGTPAGRYTWLAFHRCARDARSLTTAVARRAASLLSAAGDRAGAEAALRHGLTLVPVSEPLWRDLVRLLGVDDPGAAADVVAELQRTLAGTRLEPETEALVAHVLPAHRSRVGS